MFFLEKIAKMSKEKKLGKNRPLSCSEGHPRRGEVLRRSEGHPHRGEAERPEKAPSGSLRRSPATPRLSASQLHCGEVTVHSGPKILFCF